MKICVINGSPRGKDSLSLQTMLYLEKRFPQHEFDLLNVGTGIASFERDMSGAVEAVMAAELLIFSYPVYQLLPPYQLHRFVELLKKSGGDFQDVYVTQFTTSHQLFDGTAQRFIAVNCQDMGMRLIPGLSARPEDLLSLQGRQQAQDFLRYALHCVEQELYEPALSGSPRELPPYVQQLSPRPKEELYDTVILADLQEDDESLRAMIRDFTALYPYRTRFINLADFPFKGGCQGCLRCAMDGSCIHDDGFPQLMDELRRAKAIVCAFNIKDHSPGSRFKLFEDRQFCLGLEPLEPGRPLGCIVRGDYQSEGELRSLLHIRCRLEGSFFAGAGWDLASMEQMSRQLCYALEKGYRPPKALYGIAWTELGRKLSRNYPGLIKARPSRKAKDHVLPKDRPLAMIRLFLLGRLLRSERLGPWAFARLQRSLTAPYKKLIRKTLPMRERELSGNKEPGPGV